MSNGKIFLFGLFLCVPIVGVGVVRYYNYIQFNRNCGGYLKLAADANNVEIASQRLDKAIAYIESNNMTKGTTSILWTTPENDLELWYTNLKQAQRNLHTFPANASETDVSTALVKLRETLLDHEQSGDIVTTPHHVYLFPHNVLWCFLTIIFFIFAFFGFGLMSISTAEMSK